MTALNFETLKVSIPEFAKDIKLNITSLLNGQDQDNLSVKQIAGIALASSYACKNPELNEAIKDYAKDYVSDSDLNGIKIAVSIMAMNNIYYRFVHLASEATFKTMPARLRMNGMANSGIDKVDFELYALAVSAINGCGMCIDSHIKSLQQHGVSNEAIQTCARIAAVMHAAAQVLEM